MSNISRTDNGNYTCSAEVGSEGRYEEKSITVVVHGSLERAELIFGW